MYRLNHHITFMPPGEYNPNNPDNAVGVEAIKGPEKPKGPEKKGPNLEKLAQLKAAAEARKAELQKREDSLRTAEVPQINAARYIAQEIAVSGSPDKSFTQLSAEERRKLGESMLEKNNELLEGRESVRLGDTSPQRAESSRDGIDAGDYKAITPEMIAASKEGRLSPDGSIMKEASPLSPDRDWTEKIPPLPNKPALKKRTWDPRTWI
jgi:hypothetical protein